MEIVDAIGAVETGEQDRPFTTDEAKELIHLLLQNVSFELPNHLIDYILQQIDWLIPFYIQSILDQIRNIHRDEELNKISKATINKAILQMLEQRNHFEHWHKRIRESLQKDDYNFAKELLNVISENGTIDSNEIFNLAVKYGLESTYKDLVNSLVYDGYINNNDDHRIYRYNSPIVRMWWRKNVAN
ncbi:MAG: ATP-binding protein, partial [bacterium]